MNITKCVLTDLPLSKQDTVSITDAMVEYSTDLIGAVQIPMSIYLELEAEVDKEKKLVLAGICKNRALSGDDVTYLNAEFISTGYKNINYPKDFEGKCLHFLKYLYQHGGKENLLKHLDSESYHTIAYASIEECSRIIQNLIDYEFLSCKQPNYLPGGAMIFYDVKMTTTGKIEAQKHLPQIPLFGLVNQDITMGNAQIDSKINHARTMFFDEPRTMDKMRSACETLIFIMEPLRKSFGRFQIEKDVDDFFHMVNKFEIRHNKNTTIKFVHEEQLEWLFYCLLSTINLYVKMNKKMDE